MISVLVLAGLAVVWAIVIFPDIARWVSNNRRGDTIRTFNTQLSSLGRSNRVRRDNVIDLRERMASPSSPGSRLRAPGRSQAPRPASAAVRKRRQDVLVALGSAALLTLLATLAFGTAFLYLHLLADVLLITYLVLLQRVVNHRQPAARPRAAAPLGNLASLGTPVARTHSVQPRRMAN